MASRYKSGAIDSISKNNTIGENTLERGGEIRDEASEFDDMMRSDIEIVDEDTQNAVDVGMQEARMLSDKLVQLEISKPSQEVVNNLREIGKQMDDDAEKERANASKAEGISGDYGDVSSNLEDKVLESSEEFQEISDDGNESADDIEESTDEISAEILELFSQS